MTPENDDVLSGLDYHYPPGSDPKYRRIGKALLACLRANQAAPGSKLPNDKELARRFHTAVMTMAHALNDLAARGILERRVGAGTFIRSLEPTSQQHIRRIGVVCHETITLEGGYITALLNELFRQAPEYGFDIIQLQRFPSEYRETVESFNLHGLIVLSAELEFMPELAELHRSGMNLVQLGMWHREYADFSFGTDHGETAALAVRYLAECGHRKIGIFNSRIANGKIHHSSKRRISGSLEAVKELWLEMRPEWIINGPHKDYILPVIKKIIESDSLPTAFLIMRLPKAVEIYDILSRAGLRIPEDISLVAFDDSFLTEQLSPELTSVSQNFPELVKKVFDRLNRPDAPENDTRVLPCLIERGSCARIGGTI